MARDGQHVNIFGSFKIVTSYNNVPLQDANFASKLRYTGQLCVLILCLKFFKTVGYSYNIIMH